MGGEAEEKLKRHGLLRELCWPAGHTLLKAIGASSNG